MKKVFLLPFLILMTASLALMSFYYFDNAIRWESVPIHLFISFCGYAAVVSLSILLAYKAPAQFKKIAGIVSTIIILFSVVWFIFQHLTTFIGFLFWSDEVTFSGLISYISVLPELLKFSGISSSFFFTLAIFVVTLLFISFGFWAYHLYHFYVSPFSLSNRFYKVIKISSVVCTLLFIAYGFFIYHYTTAGLRGEPFADAFRSERIYDFRFKPTTPNVALQIEAHERFLEELELPENPPNVILIMLDAARADHMSIYGYERQTTPFLDSLYQTGKVHKTEFAVSTCSQSECGISAMLSSAFYSRIHQTNYKVQEALSDAGYSTHFLLSGDHSRLYPFMRRYYGDRLDAFKDGFDFDGYPTDDKMLIHFLEESAQSNLQTPAMFYFHLMSTHILGARYSKFDVFEPNDFHAQGHLIIRGRFSGLNDSEKEILINNYDNGMRQADQIIKLLFDSLERNGLLKDALVVITSDHGEGLGDGRVFGHAQHIHHSTIRIPLLIYSSNGWYENERSSTFGKLSDIAPTLFSVAGLPIPKSWEGYDLLSDKRTYSHHLSTFQGGNQAAIKLIGDDFFKLDYNRTSNTFSIFNLSNDPDQIHDLYGTLSPDVVEALKEVYRKEF